MDWANLWTGADIGFRVIISITLLVILYAMALMNRAIRLLQYQVSVMDNDLKLIEQEIKMVTTKDKPSLDELKPLKADD